ncbi:hypothetical protein HHI36_017715 [Cryptolaemus montrouzieri]|uniref:Dynein axonemal intermediate chain 4 n=1 Tax=Cryptolaemus montrouzieri TaxID=559131 RepID=A0ABD2NNM0_9CUCU
MFGVKHNECVGFESRWTVKKVYYEGATQTPLYVAKNATTETNKTEEVQVQTDNIESKSVEVDVDKLAEFLTNMYPKVKRELDDLTSRAFNKYKPQTDFGDTSRKLLQTIEIIPQNESSEQVNSAKLSSLSWNCSAKTLAVSLSYTHQSWCYDPGQILLFILDRDDKLPVTPSKKISCDSCVTQLQFHPSKPSLLAGSTYSGAIYLWNIQNSEDEIIQMKMSRTNDVSYMDWITLDHVTMDIVFLVTASLDGTITLWRFNSSYTCANIYERYKIKAPLMTERKHAKTRKTSVRNENGVGVTCFDFSKHLPDMFVVGTEGGLVVQCSTSKPTKLKGGTETDPLYDPVYQYYQHHEGQVISVQFSKVREDVFMTTAMDLQTRIYVIGQEEAARVIFFENSVNPLYWVPNEKHFIFGYGSNGIIQVYNVITGKIVENDEIKKNASSNLQAMCYVNPVKTNVIAVGMKKGVIELWRIPWILLGNMHS